MHLRSGSTAPRLARALALSAIWASLAAGCLPGKRDNTPAPPDTGAADGQDAAAEDGAGDAVGDGAVGDGVGPDVGGDAGAGDALADAGADAGPVALPKGCTINEDCAYLAALVPCVIGFCDSATGLCELSKKGKNKCDDGNPCTVDDRCKSGKCVGGAKVCDDGNFCTDDYCDMAVGCTATDNAIACVSDDPCAVAAHCKAGGCVADKLKDCTSANVCKVGKCNASGDCVLHNDPKLDGASCDDGQVCTEGDKCAKGACDGVETNCSDGNACTVDKCDPFKGCQHIEFYGEDAVVGCGLQDVCSTGTCADGKCTLGKSKCDDGNPCTADKCDPKKGNDACTHTKLVNKEACDDGDKCALGGQCDKGQCFAQKKLDCEDHNPCTADTCDAKTGCVHKAKAGECNDGSACTSADTCKGGKCGGTAVKDGTPCGPGKGCKAGVCT